jgi:hypothetical protein
LAVVNPENFDSYFWFLLSERLCVSFGGEFLAYTGEGYLG